MYHLKLIVVNYVLSSNLSLTVLDDNTEILLVLSTENGVHDRKSLSEIFKFLNKNLKRKTIRKLVALITMDMYISFSLTWSMFLSFKNEYK